MLAATLAHADDYLSPTDERVRLSLGVDARVERPPTCSWTAARVCRARRSTRRTILASTRSTSSPRFQAMVRVGERHRLRFDYFTLDRSGQTTITGSPIVFRDVILQPGDPVQTDLSLRIARHQLRIFLHASRAIRTGRHHRHQRHRHLGPRPRVHANPARGSDARIKAGPFPDPRSRRHLRGEQTILFRCPRPILQSWRSITSTERSSFYELARLYRLRPNVSFALGYTAVRADIDSRQTTKRGFFNFNSKGPEFFVRIAF